MLRIVLRFFGLILLACGFAALIVDGTRSLAADAFVITPLHEALATFAPAKLAALEGFARAAGPRFWSPIETTLLRLPIWFAAGVAGGLLVAITARRRPQIGYSSR